MSNNDPSPYQVYRAGIENAQREQSAAAGQANKLHRQDVRATQSEQAIINAQDIVNRHSDKQFMQRVINPPFGKYLHNGDGSRSTHSMMADINDDTGDWLVYPSVIPDGSEYGLQRLDRRDAMKTALDSGNFINFGQNKQAKDNSIWFSKNYKKYWDSQQFQNGR